MTTDIVVYDANILIDIYDMGILEKCAELGIRIRTTSLVHNEITDTRQRTMIDKYLKMEILRYDSIEQYVDLQTFISQFQNKSNLSMPDFSVLKLAKELSVPLYTSDRRLRNIAFQFGVETYGSLHIVVLLNREHILAKQEAISALEILKRTNKRISNSLIDNVIAQLS